MLSIFLVVSFLGSFIIIYNFAYGLMTKDKLAELVKEKNAQEGIRTVEPEPKSILEGLKVQVEGQKQWQKLEEQRNEPSLDKIFEELENDGIKYQTYEDRYLEITNEHYGTNYTSSEEALLGLYERYLDEMSRYE